MIAEAWKDRIARSSARLCVRHNGNMELIIVNNKVAFIFFTYSYDVLRNASVKLPYIYIYVFNETLVNFTVALFVYLAYLSRCKRCTADLK